MNAALVLGLAVNLHFATAKTPLPQQSVRAPATDSPQPPRGKSPFAAVDPRAQQRTYLFKDTNEQLPYAVFVSSKVSKEKKAPLIVALHGLGGDQNTMVRERYRAVELAEDGGYILVAPIGYKSRGWYGIPMGKNKSLRKAPPKSENQTEEVKPNSKAAPKPKLSPFSNANDPPNLRELSEKDVLTVLGLMRNEFNIDERRMYLMGHSMGGAGALYLGVKYPEFWSAIAAIAPAAFGLDPNSLEKIRDIPVIIVQGDADTAVPVTNTRRWSDKLKELNMTHRYLEIAGGMPDIFKFFGSHPKPAR
jgi:predicted peptidase